MTDTAERIMNLFRRHRKMEPGMVLTMTELKCAAKEWGPGHADKLDQAMEELKEEGCVIITPPHGLELTERGYQYLMSD